MLKKGFRFSILCLITLLSINCQKKNKNYIDYYRTINKAELAICDSLPLQALNYYKDAFISNIAASVNKVLTIKDGKYCLIAQVN